MINIKVLFYYLFCRLFLRPNIRPYFMLIIGSDKTESSFYLVAQVHEAKHGRKSTK